jgi:uncharacterized protein involved in exopolysaccharide biosynthesis
MRRVALIPEVNHTDEFLDDSAPSNSIDLAALLSTLWCSKRQIGLIGIGFAAVVFLVLMIMPNVYTSTASFIPPSSPSSASSMMSQLSALSGGLAGGLGKSQGDLYIGMLKSASVEDALIRRFNLRNVYHSEKFSVLRKSLLSASKFEADAKSSIVTISVTDRSPERARDLANGYLDALRETNGRLALLESSQRRLFFSDQLAKEKDALADAEVELKKVEEQSGLIAPAGQTMQHIQTLAEIRAQITSREVELTSLRQSATDQNPEFIRLQSEIQGLHAQLKRLQSGRGEEAADTDLPTSRVPEVQLEYIRKARDVKYHEALFEILSKQYEAAHLDESRDAPIIQILDQASYPDTKSGPHRALLTIVAFVLGLFLGSIYAWMRSGWPEFKARVTGSIQEHAASSQS